MASAFGLPKDEALKAVTLYPAQVMNVQDKLGTIEVGKMANIVVVDGDILEAKSKTRYLFIDGRQVPLTSKHEHHGVAGYLEQPETGHAIAEALDRT